MPAVWAVLAVVSALAAVGHRIGHRTSHQVPGLVEDIVAESRASQPARLAHQRPSGRRTQPASFSWSLNRVQARPLKGYGYTVNVYVVDTGINAYHDEFQSRAFPVFDATLGAEGKECCYHCAEADDLDCGRDFDGHGTGVAGIIGGESAGVSPGVKLLAVKVGHDEADIDDRKLALGLSWLLKKATSPGVIILPTPLLWSDRGHKVGQPPGQLATLVMELLQRDRTHHDGFAVVMPAHATAGCWPIPLNIDLVVVAGSSLKDTPLFFQVGCKDIYAPGERIVTADLENGFSERTGASEAAAHVAGYIALLMELPLGSTIKSRIRMSKQEQLYFSALPDSSEFKALLQVRPPASSNTIVADIQDLVIVNPARLLDPYTDDTPMTAVTREGPLWMDSSYQTTVGQMKNTGYVVQCVLSREGQRVASSFQQTESKKGPNPVWNRRFIFTNVQKGDGLICAVRSTEGPLGEVRVAGDLLADAKDMRQINAMRLPRYGWVNCKYRIVYAEVSDPEPPLHEGCPGNTVPGGFHEQCLCPRLSVCMPDSNPLRACPTIETENYDDELRGRLFLPSCRKCACWNL